MTLSAVITGAAGGIGTALARELAHRGAHLILADVRPEGLEDLARTLPQGTRGPHTLHTLDVADEDAVASFAEHVRATHGNIDLLVNNAGVNVFGTFAEQSSEDFEWLMRINLFGVIYGCRHFLPQLEATRGHIVNLSSLAGMVGLPLQSSYCTSKFAVRGFSAALRTELSAHGVGVTAVLPGAIRTSIMRGGRSSNDGITNRLAGLMERYALPPERLSRAILRAVRANRAELIVCPESHLTRWMQGVSPWVLRRTLESVYARYRGRS